MSETGNSCMRVLKCDDFITTPEQREKARKDFIAWCRSDAMQTIVRDSVGGNPGAGTRSMYFPEGTTKDNIYVIPIVSPLDISYKIIVARKDDDRPTPLPLLVSYVFICDTAELLLFETLHDMRVFCISTFFKSLQRWKDDWSAFHPYDSPRECEGIMQEIEKWKSGSRKILDLDGLHIVYDSNE